jgi:hypothetical protein
LDEFNWMNWRHLRRTDQMETVPSGARADHPDPNSPLVFRGYSPGTSTP